MTPDEQRVVQEFQARRQRANTYGWPPILVGFAALLLGGKAGIAAVEVAGVLSFITGILVVALSVRCPVCNAPPLGPMGSGRYGIILNPSRCPSCGARLR
jgi:hypothetical protein